MCEPVSPEDDAPPERLPRNEHPSKTPAAASPLQVLTGFNTIGSEGRTCSSSQLCTNGQKSRVPWAPADHQDATWLGAAGTAALLRVVPALRGLTVQQVDALATDQQCGDPREETQSYGERAFTQEETD